MATNNSYKTAIHIQYKNGFFSRNKQRSESQHVS